MSQSKRELRDQRRAVREAAEQAAAAAATRRRRAWRLAAAAGLAAILVAVGVAVSASGGSPARAVPGDAAKAVKGIPERDGVLGDPKAAVTVTEYVDLQCPNCAAAAQNTLPTLIADYVRTGKVKLQARTLHFLGPDSERAAKVAAGAARQGRQWAFLESFYAAQGAENSGYVTDDFLRSVAEAAGVDADAALAYAGTQGAQDALDRANGDAQAIGVASTPTFTIRRGDGAETVLPPTAQDPAVLSAALDKALAR